MEDSSSAQLRAIRYHRGVLQVLDQLQLPWTTKYISIKDSADGFECIKSMQVRGAPAIAIVAVLALAVELYNKNLDTSVTETIQFIESRLDYLLQSRPTAVDLGNAIMALKIVVALAAKGPNATGPSVIVAYIDAAEKIIADDLKTNERIGDHGAEYLHSLQDSISTPPGLSTHATNGDKIMRKQISVLTHCNTGSLATSGHGTALGIVRSLYQKQYLQRAFCTETRPYNQGARLTAYELIYEGIPSTLITDSMAAALFRQYKEELNIAAVVVGADRVARNGDTANKIGTYQLAILARHHGIKFIVAAPTTSIDLRTTHGDEIVIEQRKGTEMTQVSGPIIKADGNVDTENMVRIAFSHQEAEVWNPAFDVTPHELIDAIVTEHGVVLKTEGSFSFREIMPERYDEIVRGKPQKEEKAEVQVLSTVVKPDSDEDRNFRMEHV